MLNSRSAATICVRSNGVPAVCAVGLPEMPLAATLVASANVCPGRTTYRRSAPTAWDSAPKLVALVVMPVMTAVPGLAEVRWIVPEDGRAPPSLACTWRPLIVTLLLCAVPLTLRVNVILLVVIVVLLMVSSVPTLEEDPVPALNRQPLGALRISVVLDWTGISPFACSLMTMLPSVV